ncbi:SDR family NAD(P)-dependent oxidoreductase [Paenibacillus paeoniae]|uniref:SDR family NAD(P)-dependent oxidoreductase n=1 Tax=Paenibacillus paeoniae TaxID=2292705 RepID=A0A371PMS8_9BACL|nr:SDR family NAD(P)-dependent oxidoreductase [Paenibacillus paeoniae]REK77500.1 SDR family NAD(P)-dependent oxidoreductase [Paenibacillus paeoniae]
MLEGQVAIITGSGSGMGRSSALLFASEGAAVVIADMARLRGQQAADEIKASGGKAVHVTCDVMEQEAANE